MAMHLIQYTRTEVTQNQTFVEADSLAEAIALVEQYEFDDTNEYMVQSFDNTISNVIGATPKNLRIAREAVAQVWEEKGWPVAAKSYRDGKRDDCKEILAILKALEMVA